jgi:putative phosphoesterase
MDSGAWAEALHETETLTIGNVSFLVIHDLARLQIKPEESGIDAVICGHFHYPFSDYRQGVLFLNPGSAGSPRRNTSYSIALITVENNIIDTQFITFDV